MPIPDTLQETIDLFRCDGRYFRAEEDFFALPSWVQVMLGQRILPERYHPIVDDMPEHNLRKFIDETRTTLAQAVATMLTHEAWIDRYWKARVS